MYLHVLLSRARLLRHMSRNSHGPSVTPIVASAGHHYDIPSSLQAVDAIREVLEDPLALLKYRDRPGMYSLMKKPIFAVEG